jgi:hypothetical protein
MEQIHLESLSMYASHVLQKEDLFLVYMPIKLLIHVRVWQQLCARKGMTSSISRIHVCMIWLENQNVTYSTTCMLRVRQRVRLKITYSNLLDLFAQLGLGELGLQDDHTPLLQIELLPQQTHVRYISCIFNAV